MDTNKPIPIDKYRELDFYGLQTAFFGVIDNNVLLLQINIMSCIYYRKMG